jgi:nucleotide-binding universal stress UspA family protein
MAGKKRFLIAVDGSPESKGVVQYATGMLRPDATEVVLFHVMNRVPEAYWDFGMGIEADVLSKKIKQQVEAHETSIKAFMRESKKELLAADFREENVAVHIKDRKVGIARDLIAEAQGGYNGLMMGSTGTDQMKGVALGSVGTKIIGALPSIPICSVSGTPTGKNLLVALDGSPGSMRALDFVCEYMNGFKGKVILLHALRRIGYRDPVKGSVASFKEIEKLVWEDAKRILEPTMTEAKERLLKAGRTKDRVTAKFVTGVASRADALVKAAKKLECGSIVVGRTGISQVEDFNIGRVANKVVQGARNQAVWIIP